MSDKKWVDVIAIDQFTDDRHIAEIEDWPIVIFKQDQQYFALLDRCSHAGMPISEGPVENNEVICPFHGANFCIKTGKRLSQLALADLPTYETRIERGMLQIHI